MTDRDRLGRLSALVGMILDLRLAALQRAAQARAESRERLAGLDLPPGPTDLPPVVAAQAALRYQVWADTRRAEINLLLARQTVEWHEARDAARIAFGRAQALARLSRRF
jgi:hypothetical protein